MKKFLIYAMMGEKMCFLHALMNALDLSESGHEVKIVFEGKSATLPPVLANETKKKNKKALEKGLIDGVCLACARSMGVEEEIKKLELPLLADMFNHAGVKPYTDKGYEVLTF